MTFRAGIGYDLHRMETGRRLILGGVEIPFEKGLAGHSDADVISHAITDALLGAAALGDIGEHFPPSDPEWRDAASLKFLVHARDLLGRHGFSIVHVDAVVVIERPKILPYRAQIIASLAGALGLEASGISLKAKTAEGLGPIGAGDAAEAHAVATVCCAGDASVGRPAGRGSDRADHTETGAPNRTPSGLPQEGGLSAARKAAAELAAASREYSFPCAVFDFGANCERVLPGMSDVEAFIGGLLRSPRPQSVLDGLANILYWGWYRTPIRDNRVSLLRQGAKQTQLEDAVRLFARMEGAGLVELRDLGLPEFQYLSFLSKLRMFLDPGAYCVLDRKILKNIPALASRFRLYPNAIPVTPKNEAAYRWWTDLCARGALLAASETTRLRPVDVERGFFQLVDTGQAALARELFADLAAAEG